MSDMFSALLNDPQAMQKIAGLASELMGNTSPNETTPANLPEPSDSTSELMQRVMPALSALTQNNTAAHSDRSELLCALKPFLSSHTCTQIDHAEHLVSMARMAQTAVGQLIRCEKGDDVHV